MEPNYRNPNIFLAQIYLMQPQLASPESLALAANSVVNVLDQGLSQDQPHLPPWSRGMSIISTLNDFLKESRCNRAIVQTAIDQVTRTYNRNTGPTIPPPVLPCHSDGG